MSKIVRDEMDLSSLPPLTDEQRAELEALAAMPDESVDFSDIAPADEELGALADAAKGAADRAGSAIDDAMAYIAASNKRIASMESAADPGPQIKSKSGIPSRVTSFLIHQQPSLLIAKLESSKAPRYGVDLKDPQVALRIDPDGTETRGRFDAAGSFIPDPSRP